MDKKSGMKELRNLGRDIERQVSRTRSRDASDMAVVVEAIHELLLRKVTGNRRTLAGQRPSPPAHHRLLSMSRDSDANFGSSRPSSAGMKRSAAGDYFNDRGYQQAAIRTINAFLKDNSGPVERLQSSHHSAKEITQLLMFLMDLLDYPTDKLDEDLPILLKHLNSPFTVTKSVLRAPGNPH